MGFDGVLPTTRIPFVCFGDAGASRDAGEVARATGRKGYGMTKGGCISRRVSRTNADALAHSHSERAAYTDTVDGLHQ